MTKAELNETAKELRHDLDEYSEWAIKDIDKEINWIRSQQKKLDLKIIKERRK